MIRALGGVMLLCGGALWGHAAASRLSARVKTIDEMLLAAQIAQREIAFSLLPLPKMLERMAKQSEQPLKSFFSRCAAETAHLTERSMTEIWEKTLKEAELPIRPKEEELFASLGDILGKYDQTGQEDALEFLQKELERGRREAEEERNRMGRVYRVLGITAGGFLLILLL